MASAVDIANFAITKLGGNRIISFIDDTSEAIAVNLFYEHVREFCLTQYNWSFALKRTSLAADADGVEFGYTYAYNLPSDYLTLYQVGEYYPNYSYATLRNSEKQNYVIENNQILTDLEGPLKIFYLFNQKDTTRFSAPFVKYLSTLLAHEICEEITQSNTKKTYLQDLARREYEQAVIYDRMQKAPEHISDSSWLDSRINWYGGF